MSKPGHIPWAEPWYWGNEKAYVNEALESSWISGGPFVESLEKNFGEYLGADHVLTTSNGTSALHLAYLALGIGQGDEVIVPGFSFLAAANIALHVGARPVFCEVDRETWCMDPDDLSHRITGKTRAIVPVHTYGNLCEMDSIINVAKTHDLHVIEDAAEAIGSSYQQAKAGTIGDMGTFSFQATKTITTGEGGAVTSRNPEHHKEMALFRSHGMADKPYWHEVAGHNFRLTNVQAAIGCAQLESLDTIQAERERVYNRYKSNLENEAGLTLQRVTDDSDPIMWAISVLLDQDFFPQGRDSVMDHLAGAGIETRPGFYAASLMHQMYGKATLPICEHLSANILSLPSSPTRSNGEVDYICEQLVRARRSSTK